MNSIRYSRSLRATLLTSAAGLCIAMVPVAHAQINDTETAVERPTWENVVREAQNTTDRPVWEETERAPQQGYTVAVAPEPQILIANPNNPNQNAPDGSRDPVNITGVAQMFINNGNGTVGLCTGSLINPRTVIFAAHCVNSRDATAYGANSGGTPISFAFETNTRANGAGQTDELLVWYNGVGANQTGKSQTNLAQSLYNVNWVGYNARSLETDAEGFLYADVAMASLDTPARGIPTWAMLFSALPTTPGGPGGTGYHVNITGYGNAGSGETGATGIDFRRRVAENMLGALASLNDFGAFLFGDTPGLNGDPNLPQNLYWIDFDDPRRGTASASPFDFNAWRDNSVPNGNEGITSQGDSGGPLILDSTYSRQLIIGVLSGGYNRFFTGQPANSYGTAAFYQPLYLYWDWVAANNPYHYVSAVAGNGNWTDPTHWVSNLDPNYFIIGPNGQVINGIPGTEGQTTADLPGFGEVCFQSGGLSDCLNIATGVNTFDPTGHPIGTGDVGTAGGVVNGRTIIGGESLTAEGAQREAQAGTSGVTIQALPAATIDNGLPGATNFVPNNSNGDRLTGVKPRYFDVTLAASGITTLDSAVTIDRFGIAGPAATLNITSTGSLTSLMEINQITGTMQVNGTLTSVGDYYMLAGGLNGTGTITAPFFTSVAGTISPGTTGAAGTVGTLTFRGNIVLSSGNTYMVDIGASGTSDRIVVNANGTGTGLANLGGRLVFNPIAPGATLRAGNTYTILTSQGGISGSFTATPFSAILTPQISYTANAVTMTVQVVPGGYGTLIPQTDTVGFSYALLLDRNRPQAGSRDSLFGPLDQQNAATIRSTLASWQPAAETTVQSLGMAGIASHQGFVGQRLASLDPGSTGGDFARYGAPNQVAAVGLAGRSVAGLSGMGYEMSATAGGGAGAPMIQEGVLPEGTSGFVAGGYLKGDSAAATGVAGRDDYDGWFVAAGIETWDDQAGVGFSASYTQIDSTGAFAGNTARAKVYQGTLYGKIELKGGLTIDAAFSAGLLDGSTRRAVTLVGTPYVLTSNTGNLIVVSEAGLGGDIEMGNFKLTPRVAGRATHIGFSRSVEEGGPMALEIDRAPINSVQGRAGLTFSGTGKVRPFVSAYYVHEFEDRPNVIGANFAGGLGGNVLFDLNGVTDRDYGEVSGGLTISTGTIDLSVSAETTVERTDVKGQAYRGSISFKF